MNARRYVSPKEVGESTAYPFSERYIRRLIFERRIPYSKVGAKVFIATDDLDRLLAHGRVDANSGR